MKIHLKFKIENLKLLQNLRLRTESGVVVIMTILLIGIFLSIALALSAIFIPKLRTATDIKSSIAAAYAAESAIEWCLYINRRTPPLPVPNPPVMTNGATFINGNTGVAFTSADCSASTIKSIGTYQGISRSFEVSF